jgi:hypothetical protein
MTTAVATRSAPVAISARAAERPRRSHFTVRWRTLLVLTIGVIFLVPIKRYTLPASLPFSLEPYRLMIGMSAVAWVTSLLIDRRLRMRPTGMAVPLAALLFVEILSIVVNAGTLANENLTSLTVKAFTFELSFFVLFIFAVNVMRTREDINRVVRVMVALGAIVALEVVIEYRTHVNLFNDVGKVMPFLHQVPLTLLGLDPAGLAREGTVRAYGSAENPIECSAFLAILVPLGLYLYTTTGQRRWLAATLVIALGVLGTVSRTGVVMLAVIGIVYFRKRRKATVRALPVLLPALLVVLATAPHIIGSFYNQFFPKGGLIAQQSAKSSDGQQLGQGDNRLARVGPDLAIWSKTPFFGQGFGSRDASPQDTAQLHVKLSGQTDDQWLESLLTTGLLGVLALVWLFFRATRRLKWIVRTNDGSDGWLAVALLASVDAFMIGMFTFDALGFVEDTIAFFLILALAAALVGVHSREPDPSMT